MINRFDSARIRAAINEIKDINTDGRGDLFHIRQDALKALWALRHWVDMVEPLGKD